MGTLSSCTVFFHGLSGNRHAWEPQLAALSDLRRCVAWDAPGYGDSSAELISLPQLADAAAAWIETLTDQPVDVCGLSFGGMIAQHLALRHQHLVRTLALLDTSPAFGMDGTTTRESWLAARVDPMRSTTQAPERASQVVDGLVAAGCPAGVRADAIAAMRAVPATTLDAACRALVDHNTLTELPMITVPTIVMVGADDTETPPSYARAIADRIADALLIVVPGAGHLVNVEAPEATNTALRTSWLAAARATR